MPGIDAILAAEARLCIASSRLDVQQTCVTLFCPALFAKTLGMLANPRFLKLCGDGTFRLIRNKWVVLTLGVIVRRHARGEKDALACCRVHFKPLMFAIANKESEPTYARFFEDAVKVAERFGFATFRQDVKQYHADWHCGEELARKSAFPLRNAWQTGRI